MLAAGCEDAEPKATLDSSVASPEPTKVATLFPTSTPGTTELTIEKLDIHLSRWQARSFRDYKIYYQNVSLRAMENREMPVVITVRDGSIESVVNQSDGEPIQGGSYPDVENLFSMIRSAIRGGYEVIGVAFHQQLGYPTSGYLAYVDVPDGGKGFRATVVPLSASGAPPTATPVPKGQTVGEPIP